MKASTILLVWMAFFVLCPVLKISGHFIYPPEIFIYIAFLGRMISSSSNSQNLNNTSDEASKLFAGIIRAHLVYAILFVAAVLLSAYITEQSINNYDVYVFRNILQVILCLKLFDSKLHEIRDEELDRLLFNIIVVLCVPAAIVYLQRLDILELRNIVIELYKPQFFFLNEAEFQTYRYTSVFKDFFTSAVYFTILASLILYFIFRTNLGITSRTILVLLLCLVYGAQLFVARTSLVMIPLLGFAIAIFAAPWNINHVFGRMIPMAVLVIVVGYAGSQYLLDTGLVNSRWALQSLDLFETNSQSKDGSLALMQDWNDDLLDDVLKKDSFIYQPLHSYNLTERTHPGIYTDSFYGQELHRYGIYGAIAYLSYVALMLIKTWRNARYVFLLVVALAIMNVKGGNTYFMPKNIYLYALVLAFLPRIIYRKPS